MIEQLLNRVYYSHRLYYSLSLSLRERVEAVGSYDGAPNSFERKDMIYVCI
jgi:hypothetical protein